MSFLQFKHKEEDLKARFGDKIAVRVEPIEPADVYYTDGDASSSVCKLIFTGGNTVYLPQLIYNVKDEHKTIIQAWMDYVKGLNE
jgi:hypothetical protein